MRQRGVLLLTLGLVLASFSASALPSPPPGPFFSHAPIVITSNAHFNASNGVVAGSGAVGDPFIISGWAFVTSGVAIRIEGVTAAFVIRDNSFDAGTGVHITQTTQVGVVLNNQFVVRGTGVLVTNADAHIVDNSFLGNPALGANGKGVELQTSNSRVESNAFLYLKFGVYAERGSPSIICNDIHDDVFLAGIYVKLTTGARIECNVITQCTLAIRSEAAFGTIIANNTITSCFGGIEVYLTKDVVVANNTVTFTLHSQIRIDVTSGNVTGNVVIMGRADGIVVAHSPVLLANNSVSANIGVGIRVSSTWANVSGNFVASNAVGIVLEANALPTLYANVMVNNTVGIDIPYASRQVIVNMSANVVNGFNIDGSINASQRVYFYKQANVNISGQVRDSGFSAGFYGSLTAQGGVVLYEVDTVNVNATVISHHTVGVGIVNSFNVNVNSSLVVSNLVGIRAEVKTGVGIVPNCVVSSKDTNITIPVDPIATIGIDVHGCLGLFTNVTVSVVDIGIKVNGAGSIHLANSTVFETRIGIDVQAVPNGTNISGNLIMNNRIGARLSGTVGLVKNNTIIGNADVGVRLENSADLVFEDNNVSFNGRGVVDAEVCGGSLTCSSLDARRNVFLGNRGVAAQVQGTTSWRGDLAIGNEGDGFLLGNTHLRAVVSIGNEGDGARIVGEFEVEDSNFSGNGEDGLQVIGDGHLEDSVFIGNEDAGIRLDGTHVTALRVNVSHNFDGIAVGDATSGTSMPPSIPPASLPNLLPFLWDFGPGGPAPLEIMRSSLIGNERDAIRAGSAIVTATHNYWGRPQGPSVNVGDTVGAFQNGVTPGVRFLPYYTDPAMTTTGPVFLL